MVERYGFSLNVIGGRLEYIPRTAPAILIASHLHYSLRMGLLLKEFGKRVDTPCGLGDRRADWARHAWVALGGCEIAHGILAAQGV